MTADLRLLLLAAFAGCSSDGPQPASVARPWQRALAERASDAFPRDFVDARGIRQAIPAPARRIASATLFTDVVLLAICPSERIAALHEVSGKPFFSPVAAASRAFPHHVGPDPESVLAVRPDLVFLATFSDERMERLVSGSGRTILRLGGFDDIRGIADNIRAVGYVLGLDAGAEALVETMERRLAAVREKAESRRKWRVLSYADGFVSGQRTIFDDVLAHVGARNVAAEAGIVGVQRLDSERVLALSPDALVVGVAEGGEAEMREQLQRIGALRLLPAVQRGRIVHLPNHLFYDATQHVASTAEQVARALDEWDGP